MRCHVSNLPYLMSQDLELLSGWLHLIVPRFTLPLPPLPYRHSIAHRLESLKPVVEWNGWQLLIRSLLSDDKSAPSWEEERVYICAFVSHTECRRVCSSQKCVLQCNRACSAAVAHPKIESNAVEHQFPTLLPPHPTHTVLLASIQNYLA